MIAPDLDRYTYRHATTVLEDVVRGLQEPDLRLSERFKLLGARGLIDEGITPVSDSRRLAELLDVSSTELRKKFPDPMVDLVDEGVWALRADFFSRRHSTLLEAASQLALSRGVRFNDAVTSWAEVYQAVGNPGAILRAGLSAGEAARGLVEDHQSMFNRCLNLLGLREGFIVSAPISFNIALVLGNVDMSAETPVAAVLSQMVTQFAKPIESAPPLG